jgi:hypothetical protein
MKIRVSVVMPYKPIVFISYAHADEPEHPALGEVRWLSFVRGYLKSGEQAGLFEVWVDRELLGGADWNDAIEQKLRACDIFLLLVSQNSAGSNFIINNEIAIIEERERKGEDVCFYPLLIKPPPASGFDRVKHKNVRPREADALSNHSHGDCLKHMKDVADEIEKIARQIAERRGGLPSAVPSTQTVHIAAAPPAYVNISGLPETAYQRLVGRDAELRRLDEAWADRKVNILSLVAEGGAGKSALVNDWLRRLQAEDYRGAEIVLGWSFYSQGTKERATSAELFLDWALDKLGLEVATTSASAKGEAIAEAMMRRRALLLLDGAEPLQHGPGPQKGQLKDQGLRALLRRFAATPPGQEHGLIVLTSRLAVADIAGPRLGAALVVDVQKLSDEAGAALLRDNAVRGTDKELRTTAHEFGGHPLALGMLASFLKETQQGDVRRRDHIRAFLADGDNPGHDHAARVMESYEKEWLAGRPVLLAVMHIVGLFDRPASGDCLAALRAEPVIAGLTDSIVGLDNEKWERAVARLRDARLLAPSDPSAPDALDAHPLVREWFGERLRKTNEAAWKAAHGRLYEHLRDMTREGETPTLSDLAPLYQAIAHGCRAGRHHEALHDIYQNRICRRGADGRIEFHASKKLGAFGSNLAAISWFFVTPYATPVATLTAAARGWVLSQAGYSLRAQGRIADALPAMRAIVPEAVERADWRTAAIRASNLSLCELLVGAVAAAVTYAVQSVDYADRSGDEFQMLSQRTTHADALHAAGRRDEAARCFADAEQRQQKWRPAYPLLFSLRGYRYCDLLLSNGEPAVARDRANRALEVARRNNFLLDVALDTLTLARAGFASALIAVASRSLAAALADARGTVFDQAVEALRASGDNAYLPVGLLARAAFRRSGGDWPGAGRDLDEVEEIAEPGPMRLFLCDTALERARLAFARIEAFAPLNGLVDDSPPKPALPDAAEAARLGEVARANLDEARKLIESCGYHRRDEELAELRDVLAGKRRFADLPPRV